MSVTPEVYAFLSDLLKKNSGLSLGTGKEYLIEGRLPPVATTFGLSGLDALVQRLRGVPDPKLLKAVCDAMTTGETLFFRDGGPFDAFRDRLLPEAAQRARAAKRPLRLWVAATSTGQEVYSLLMLVAQAGAVMDGVRLELVATDYCTASLERARQGIYNQFEVQRGLPVQLLVKFFQPVPQGYQVIPALREQPQFSEQNLLRPFTNLGMFDIVFVRNVLIYFDVPDKADVLTRIARQLHPGGVVVLGGTESILGITDALARLDGYPAPVYARTGDPVARAEGKRSAA